MSAAANTGAGTGYWGDLSGQQQKTLLDFLVEAAKVRRLHYSAGAAYLNETVGDDATVNVKAHKPNKIIYEALRFLRARNFDLQASLLMYTNHQKWRQRWQVDTLLVPANRPSKLDLVMKIIPHQHIAYDRAGRPVLYEKLGKCDPVALTKLVTADEYLKCHIWKYETLWAAMNEYERVNGKHIETFTLVLDLRNVRIDVRKSTGYLNLCSKSDADNNPERLGRLVCINTPLLFRVLWGMASPLIDEKTKKKISIVYGDPTTTLTDIIDPSQLPSEYGGTNSASVKEFDLKELSMEDLIGKDAESQELKVGAGKTETRRVPLKAGKTLFWYYRVETGTDIQLIVSFESATTNEDIETTKSSTDQGSYSATVDGEIVLEFNNSYSWFTGKTLKYSAVELDSSELNAGASASSSSSSSS